MAESSTAAKPKKRTMPPRLTRAQITEALETTPIETILGVKQQLTAKQRAFAQEVAKGNTKAQAYRNAYNDNPAPSTIVTAPYNLAADPRVKREIEAYRLALEAEKLRNPAQLKAHLIHQLVQHSINPETPPAQQIKALELIGKLYEVGAFEERKTTTVIHQKSGDLKAQLVERIKSVIDIELKPGRAGGQSLLDEIQGANSNSGDPTGSHPPATEVDGPGAEGHTIQLNQSILETTPLDVETEKVGGVHFQESTNATDESA